MSKNRWDGRELYRMVKEKKEKWWMKRNVYESPITVRDFKRFLAIILYSSSSKEDCIKNYWNRDTLDAKHTFVRNLMVRDRFMMMYSSFYFSDQQLLDLEPATQELIQSLWITASAVVVDETMVATKCRENPHHIFIFTIII